MELVPRLRELTKDLEVDVPEFAEGATIWVVTPSLFHMEVQTILGRLMLSRPPVPLYPDDEEKEFMSIAEEIFNGDEDFPQDLFKKFVREWKLEAHFPDIEWSEEPQFEVYKSLTDLFLKTHRHPT